MITLKDFMEIVDYRITEGSDYQWACFGPTAYRLDSWNGDQDGHTVSVLFDTHSQEVYQVEAFDYRNERAYRMTNPKYKDLYNEECEHRDVMDMAWERDDGTPVEYVDLDVEEDFIEKARAIVTGKDYDTRVKISVDLDDDTLFQMMKLAHERDITFNQLVEIALQEAIDQHRMLNDIDMRDEYDFSEANRIHVSNTDNPIDFPVERKKKKKGKK